MEMPPRSILTDSPVSLQTLSKPMSISPELTMLVAETSSFEPEIEPMVKKVKPPPKLKKKKLEVSRVPQCITPSLKKLLAGRRGPPGGTNVSNRKPVLQLIKAPKK